MNQNPLKKLETFGQSIWLDYIKRDMFSSRQLQQFILNDGLRGITSNPSIFEKSIVESHDYDLDIKRMRHEGKNVQQIYEALTQQDVQTAADELYPLYQQTHGMDGYVSLEVNPHLAKDTQGTIEEARRFWKALDRPNVLIKVPATKEGLPAIQQLISEGINVNVTLLFGLSRYREVAQAYIAGIENRLQRGESVSHIASVASFFLSRIDVLLDPILETHARERSPEADIAQQLVGEVAIASAKGAYGIFKELFHSEHFKLLADKQANVQRLLWASTSTKNPLYSDLKYVEALIGPQTVNTLPLETLEAYRDHGDPALRLDLSFEKVSRCFQALPKCGIDIEKIAQQLEDEAVDKFIKAYDKLINSLAEAQG